MKTPTTIDLADLNAALAARKGDIVRKPGGATFRVVSRRRNVVVGRPTDAYGCDGDTFDSLIDLTAYVAA